MPKQKFTRRTGGKNESIITKNISNISNTIKEAVSIPVEIGQAVQKEMSEFLLKATNPLRTEFRPRDLLQVIVGASILAIPVGFNKEISDLGNTIHTLNIIILIIISIVFIWAFVYYNYYRGKFRQNWTECVKRVCSTYIFSILVVAGLLTIIESAQWNTDFISALKQVIIVAFPASMSAVVADTIK